MVIAIDYKNKDFGNYKKYVSLVMCDFCKIEYDVVTSQIRRGLHSGRCPTCAKTENMKKLWERNMAFNTREEVKKPEWQEIFKKLGRDVSKHPNSLKFQSKRTEKSKVKKEKYEVNKRPKRGFKLSPEHIKNKALAQTGNKNHRWNPDRIQVKLRKVLYSRCKDFLKRSLNGYKKQDRTYSLLGYTSHELQKYIESTWESWMNWDNYGCYKKQDGIRKWSIDHIKSIAQFHKEGILDIKIINALSNLKAMDSVDNSKKGRKEQS